MLPVYKAISVDQEAIISGSTKPCIMMVADSNGKIVGDYVVKVFKPSNIEQSQPTNKEAYGNALARAFDLAVSVVSPHSMQWQRHLRTSGDAATAFCQPAHTRKKSRPVQWS